MPEFIPAGNCSVLGSEVPGSKFKDRGSALPLA